MDWAKFFGIEEPAPKPKNIYESGLYSEWLDTLSLSEHSKVTYATYRDRLCEWMDDHELITLDTNNAEKFLLYQVSKAGARSAFTRWSLFNRYNAWLIARGNLTVNPWEKCDLELCGCDRNAIVEELARKKAAKEPKPADTAEAPKFTLSDIALLLIAIEEHDEDTIKRVLNQ